MIDYPSVGRRISHYRRTRGVTQEYLAELVGVSLPHMSRIENGHTKPSLQVLVDLANALEVKIDDLLCDSVAAARQQQLSPVISLLDDCSAEEVEMLAQVIDTVLRHIRKNGCR